MTNTQNNYSVNTENTNVESSNLTLTKILDNNTTTYNNLSEEVSDVRNDVKIWINDVVNVTIEQESFDYIKFKRWLERKKYALDDFLDNIYFSRDEGEYKTYFKNILNECEKKGDLYYFFENISLNDRRSISNNNKLWKIKAEMFTDFFTEFKETDYLANWYYEIKHKDLLIKLMLRDFSKEFIEKIISRLTIKDAKEILISLGESKVIDWIEFDRDIYDSRIDRNDILYSMFLFRVLSLKDAKEAFNSLPENKKLDLIEVVRRENLWKIDFILNIYNKSLESSLWKLERDEEKIWSKIVKILFLDRIIPKFKKQRNDYEEKRNNIQQEYDFKLSQIELHREAFWENFREDFFGNFDRYFYYIQEEIGTWKIDELIRKAYEAQKYK